MFCDLFECDMWLLGLGLEGDRERSCLVSKPKCWFNLKGSLPSKLRDPKHVQNVKYQICSAFDPRHVPTVKRDSIL